VILASTEKLMFMEVRAPRLNGAPALDTNRPSLSVWNPLNEPFPAGLVKLIVTPPEAKDRLVAFVPLLEKSNVMMAAAASNDTKPKINAGARKRLDEFILMRVSSV
jgi:hypothetical protein